MSRVTRFGAGLMVLVTLGGLGACGGKDSKAPHTVGGTVSGLSGSGLVLTNNGDSLTVSANGNFTFARSVTDGDGFSVSVATQPASPAQTCSVAYGAGTINGSDITNVAVTCTTNTYTIGGTVTGLSGSGLVLTNNGLNNLTVSASGAFTFTTSVASGATYAVAVATQPTNPPQTCTVTNAGGTVAAANVTNVAVSCTTNTYAVVGYVSGLTGTGLKLTYNGGAPVAVSANGPTVLASATAIGTAYTVTIASQPATPAQTCVLSNGSGTVATANVTSISVYCPNSVGRFAYLAGAGSIPANSTNVTLGTLSPYTIDSTTGALTAVMGGTVASGPSVASFQLIPHTHFAWALSLGDYLSYSPTYGNSTLFVYTVDPASGLLTPASGNPYQTLNGSSASPACSSNSSSHGFAQFGKNIAFTFFNSGTFGYAANGSQMGAENASLWQFTVDPSTGLPTLAANPVAEACAPTKLVFDASGRFAYVGIGGSNPTTIMSYAVDASTGALTPLPNASISFLQLVGLHADPAGRFVYAMNPGGGIQTYDIDYATGELTAVGTAVATNYGNTMTIDPRGRFAYVGTQDGIVGFSIDPATGVLSPAAAIGTIPAPDSNALGTAATLHIDPSGQFAYLGVAGGVNAYTVDATTGALTLVSGSPFASGSGSVVLLSN